LLDLVRAWRGRGFVLQDKLPAMDQAEPWPARGRFNFTFVGTFSADEPVGNVVAAARLLPDDHVVHITGNTALADPGLLKDAPANVVFTGFLPEAAYQGLLAASDAVLGLTTRPHTLLCCAYEAVALRRPLILSDHEDLLAYFHRGVVPTDNTPESLAAAMREVARRRDELGAEAVLLAQSLSHDWDIRFAALQSVIAGLEPGTPAQS
ncbi:glycosyltransferase family 4 protein, partial [bacterium]|nr:glycosyltransferase family 4 protein [bacterium]